MAAFLPGGPPRMAHQKRGLRKLIETRGVGALLFDPGTGKTATTLDYMSILAQKVPPTDGVQEARILVVCPLAAVDTWVKQAAIWVSPQVNYWSEVLGGSITDRAWALAARGGAPFTMDMLKKAIRGYQKFSVDERSARRGAMSGYKLVAAMGTPREGLETSAYSQLIRRELEITAEEQRAIIDKAYKHPRRHAPRVWGYDSALDWGARVEGRTRPITATEGPDGLGSDKPKLIIEVLNLDTFASRLAIANGSKTMADLMLDAVKRYNPHLVVIDESHKIKGPRSNVSRLMDRVGQVVPRRIILTGTVMPAGPLDVFAQWRFLDPFAFGERQPDGTMKRATFDSFQQRYAVMGGWQGKEVVGFRNLEQLQTIMGHRAAVARKADVLELAPIQEIVVPVLLSPAEKKAYTDMKKSLATDAQSGILATASNRLAQMMRLRQITAGHLPDDMGIMHHLGDSKVNTIRSIAHDTLAGKKRIVVFCLFTEELHMLTEKLKESGTIVMAISGETPADERMRYRVRFGSDEPTRMIIVAQIRTISLAVNELVTAQDIIFGSLSQQRDDLIQGIDRAHRMGQMGQVTIWYAEAPGTIDGVIHTSHRDRTKLESAVLKHILDEGDFVDLSGGQVQRLQGSIADDTGSSLPAETVLEHEPDDDELVDLTEVEG